MNQLRELMAIKWTLPWGNDGRGTPVYLWPFLGVQVIANAAQIVDWLVF